ncbi:hypothetical protein Daus18300_005535 [Diaporthe australafricana]|uniref:Uncharacterized protein n=1 Tax=Diaporthe australafricana TaxID=127596 RepID=A0ABR3X0U4_9PEZI
MENIYCPNDDRHKYTIVTSSCTETNSALFTPPNPVYISCATCTATTLPVAAITPGAAAIQNPAGFSPVNTMTIGGGAVVFGSMSVDGKAVNTAYAVNTALAIPGNAPQVTGVLTAQVAKAASSNAPLVTASAKPVDVVSTGGAIVNVNTKAADSTNVNTKTAEAPANATQSIQTVLTGAAASNVNDLALLCFMLLYILI